MSSVILLLKVSSQSKVYLSIDLKPFFTSVSEVGKINLKT